jgi:hypothetical protein
VAECVYTITIDHPRLEVGEADEMVDDAVTHLVVALSDAFNGTELFEVSVFRKGAGTLMVYGCDPEDGIVADLGANNPEEQEASP